jgi:hypothetical protein
LPRDPVQAGGKVEQVAVKPKDLRAHYSDDELDGLVSNDEEGDEGAARAFMGKYSLTPHTHTHHRTRTHAPQHTSVMIAHGRSGR